MRDGPAWPLWERSVCASYNTQIEPPAAKSRATLLEAQPVCLETLGISIQMPLGSKLIRDATASLPGFTILDGNPSPRFHIRLVPLRSELDFSSPKQEVQRHLDALKAQGANWDVLRNVEVNYGDAPGHELWISQKLPDGLVAVMGWAVSQVGPQDFLCFSVMTSGMNMIAAERTLDASLATIEFIPMEVIRQQQSARTAAGAAILSRLRDEELIRQMAPVEPTWYRIYSQDAVGNVSEMGYMLVSAAIEPRVAVDSNERPTETHSISAQDKVQGLLVRVRSRVLMDPKGFSFSDTDARFWIALDRTSEIWSAIVSERQAGKVRTFGQTGIRATLCEDEPRPPLVVAMSGARTKDGDARRWTPNPETYLTQAEHHLMGRVAAVLQEMPAEAGFFAYESTTQSVPFRLDRWKKTASGWTLETEAVLDAPPSISEFDSRGVLIKSTDVGGTITERTTHDALLKRWKQLGLPVEGPTS